MRNALIGLFVLGALGFGLAACGDDDDGAGDAGADADTDTDTDTDTDADSDSDTDADAGTDGGTEGTWSCEESYYADGYDCDCGCTVADPDCAGVGCTEPGCQDTECDYCYDAEANEIDCVETPAEWTCPGGYYGQDDGCDCGCGAPDPDCAGLGCIEPGCQDADCEYCYDADGEDMISCIEGWTCYTEFYSDEYCDCGCSIADPTCAGAGCTEPECDADGCEYCYDATGDDVICGEADGGVGDAGAK